VGIGKCLAANSMCIVWATKSRSLGWYSVIRDAAVVNFYSVGTRLEGVVRTGVLRMRLGSL
jgi:hypothetical protein